MRVSPGMGGNHLSWTAIAGSLTRLTRGLGRAALKRPRQRTKAAVRHHALLPEGFT